MPEEVGSSTPRQPNKVLSFAIAVVYVSAAGLVGLLVKPLDVTTLLWVAFVPGILAALVTLPRLFRTGPSAILALFHLVIFPLAIVIGVGLPGVLFALLVAEQFG